MLSLNEEKDQLTLKLSEQYSQNIIGVEEYERVLEYLNKIETEKEIGVIRKIIRENDVKDIETTAPETPEKHLSVFSWRSSNVKSLNGNGGKYTAVFGTSQIIADNLPKGRTVINVGSIFGLTEIIVSKNVKIVNKTVPVFSGIFAPNEADHEGGELPELYITGTAVFGNITIKRAEEKAQEQREYNELAEKIKEKVYQKIIDKM